ncbi:uncharacterized protein ACIBXB_003842 [Morphnus guianensis]
MGGTAVENGGASPPAPPCAVEGLWERRGRALPGGEQTVAAPGAPPAQDKAAASPSPATACPCPSGRRDPGTVTSLCIPRRVLGSTGGAGGTQEGQQEKKKQEGVGGKTNNQQQPTNTTTTTITKKKGNFAERGTVILWSFKGGRDGRSPKSSREALASRRRETPKEEAVKTLGVWGAALFLRGFGVSTAAGHSPAPRPAFGFSSDPCDGGGLPSRRAPHPLLRHPQPASLDPQGGEGGCKPPPRWQWRGLAVPHRTLGGERCYPPDVLSSHCGSCCHTLAPWLVKNDFLKAKNDYLKAKRTSKAAWLNIPRIPGSRRGFSRETRCSQAAVEAAGADELLSCRLLLFAVGGADCKRRQEEAFSQPRKNPRRWCCLRFWPPCHCHPPPRSSPPLATVSIPAVLSPGSILASTQGSGGQQILHAIHTIPSVNLPSKMGNLQTIPVVVQSLPVVYTTMPTDGVTAITVPLIGGDGKNTGSAFLSRPPPVKIDPGSMYPMDMNSDSEDSAFQDLQREPAARGQRADSPDLKKRRIHQCDFEGCNKVYTESSHLKAHRRIHTGRGQRRTPPCPGVSGSVPPAPDGLGAPGMGCTGRWWSIPGLGGGPLGVPTPCARAGGGSLGAWGGFLGVAARAAFGGLRSLGVLAACVMGLRVFGGLEGPFGGASTLCQGLGGVLWGLK